MYFSKTKLNLFIFFLVTVNSSSELHIVSRVNCQIDDVVTLPTRQQVALFIFGDSLFDAGNNNYINTTTEFQANFWPYGESFFDHPTGRFSNGRLIPDFIAEYAKLPLIPTFLPHKQHKQDQFTHGVNFASGGAGALVESHQGFAIDFKTQLGYFKIVEKQLKQKLGDEAAQSLLSEAVYLISIGGNDYFDLFTSNSTDFDHFSKKQFVGMVIANLTTVIKEIYKIGGRKFGFASMCPLGCLPGMKVLFPESTDSCIEDAQVLAQLHNNALSELLQELESQLEGFKYSNHDFFTSFSQRFNNPSKYGFKEAATACCGSGPYRGIYSCGGMRGMKEYELCDNPNEYLFFDSDHCTEKAYEQIAELMWNGTPNVTGPYNLKMLFEHELKSHTVAQLRLLAEGAVSLRVVVISPALVRS